MERVMIQVWFYCALLLEFVWLVFVGWSVFQLVV